LSSDEGKNEGMSDDEQKKPKMLLRKRSNKVNVENVFNESDYEEEEEDVNVSRRKGTR
jgi:hypothetical protein